MSSWSPSDSSFQGFNVNPVFTFVGLVVSAAILSCVIIRTACIWFRRGGREGNGLRESTENANTAGQHPTSNGLDESILNSYELVKYVPPSSHGDLEGGVASVCTICLGEYEADELLRRLPCRHSFHSDCIKSWLGSHVTCPVCRCTLLPENKEAESATGQNVDFLEQSSSEAGRETARQN